MGLITFHVNILLLKITIFQNKKKIENSDIVLRFFQISLKCAFSRRTDSHTCFYIPSVAVHYSGGSLRRKSGLLLM